MLIGLNPDYHTREQADAYAAAHPDDEVRLGGDWPGRNPEGETSTITAASAADDEFDEEATRERFEAAESFIGCPILADDSDEPALAVALREQWSLGRVREEIAGAIRLQVRNEALQARQRSRFPLGV